MRIYHTDDKTEWPDGPWKNEPDKMVWVDGKTDLDCMIHRNRVGALCGYVGVPPDHPWHGKDYQELDDVEIHGGLTYSDRCQEGTDEADGLCHVPEPGREHDIWWVGFDCIHGQDLAPMVDFTPLARVFTEPDSPFHRTYKTVDYVMGEIQSLAEQAAEAR